MPPEANQPKVCQGHHKAAPDSVCRGLYRKAQFLVGQVATITKSTIGKSTGTVFSIKRFMAAVHNEVALKRRWVRTKYSARPDNM